MTLEELSAQARQGDDGFHRWDGMAMEREYAEFMYALTVAQKPGIVLESGTGRGVTSRYIAEALKKNGTGQLVTFEPLEQYRHAAVSMLHGLPAMIIDGDSRDYAFQILPDIMFLDSGPDTRLAEIEYWLGFGLPETTAVVVHDANRAYPLPDTGVRFPGGDGLWVGTF